MSKTLVPDLSGPFPDVYCAAEVEKDWYPWWEHKGYFKQQEGRKGT